MNKYRYITIPTAVLHVLAAFYAVGALCFAGILNAKTIGKQRRLSAATFATKNNNLEDNYSIHTRVQPDAKNSETMSKSCWKYFCNHARGR